MAEDNYKILLFMKRRPGMTFEAFQDYYENQHAPLCVKYASGISRYVRRFLTPHPNPETGASEELLRIVQSERLPGVRVVRAPCIGSCHTAPVAEIGQRPFPNAGPIGHQFLFRRHHRVRQ